MKSIYKMTGIEVRKAGVKGRGVFATKAFRKGEVIEISPIIQISSPDGDFISCTKLGNYSFAIGLEGDHGHAIALGYASLYNHSATKDNCDYILNSKVIIITALRPIKKGEELLFDYGWDDATLKEAGIRPDR